MTYKVLIFGTDDLYDKLKPFYDAQIQRGNLEIVAYAVFDDDIVQLFDAEQRGGVLDNTPEFHLAIISSHKNFYRRMKLLEAQNLPRKKIIDGRALKIPDLDFKRLVDEGIAYGSLNKKLFQDMTHALCPRILSDGTSTVEIGSKSYLVSAAIEGSGRVSVGKFCSVAKGALFNMWPTVDHNYRNVSSYALTRIDWDVPEKFFLPKGTRQINIGNDVWIGRGCVFKATTSDKPLVIGDGAVIASDSVIVKNVPPYAIVGGNPAKIIKFRFAEDVIEAFLRIKWWNWSLDKIHDNFRYFNDIDKFISIHDV